MNCQEGSGTISGLSVLSWGNMDFRISRAFHLFGTGLGRYAQNNPRSGKERMEEKMTLIQKRIITLAIVILAGIVLGRLAVRAVLNLLVGGSMFGGNFL